MHLRSSEVYIISPVIQSVKMSVLHQTKWLQLTSCKRNMQERGGGGGGEKNANDTACASNRK